LRILEIIIFCATDNTVHTDKKENQIFLIYKEIQSGAVAKSNLTNGLLIYGEISKQVKTKEKMARTVWDLYIQHFISVMEAGLI
jgi:hypothetical protein